MKKVYWFIMIVMATNLLFGLALVSAIEITEFESNPFEGDSGNEWIELYSEEEFELDDYYLENADGNIYELEGTFSGYFVVQFESQWLDNVDERVYLKYEEDNATIDSTPLFDDGDNDNNSWNKCNDEWIFIESSKGEENLCGDEDQNNNDDSNNDSDGNDSNDDDSNLINNSENNQEIDTISTVQTNQREKIVLNAPIQSGGVNEIENEDNAGDIFISKQERLRMWVIYSFLIFAVLLIILLALRRL